jgi:putative endopeptidase
MRVLVPLLLASSFLLVPASAQEITSPQFGKWGVDLTSVDKTVKPGDNFFDYVNGAWLKTAVIPPDRSATGSFQDLQILSEKRMRAIVDDLEKKPEASLSPDEKKLRDLYDAFEDTAAIEAGGLKPVQKDLDYLNGLKTPEDVARAMASPMLGSAWMTSIPIRIRSI